MTPDERELLTQSIKLSEENNKMLRGMRRSARFAAFLRIVYWIIIIGSAITSYYFIKPFIDPLIKGFSTVQQNIQSVKDTTAKVTSPSTWFNGKQ